MKRKVNKTSVFHVIHYKNSGIITVVSSQVLFSTNENIFYKVIIFETDNQLEDKLKSKGIECVTLGLNRYNYLKILFKYISILKENNPEIIHTHSFLPRLFTAIVSKIFIFNRKHIISTFHNDYPYFSRSSLRDKIKRYLECKSITATKATLLCCSKQIEERISKIYGLRERVHLIHHGIPMKPLDYINRVEKVKTQNTITAVSVGRLSNQKNYSFLLNCWAEIVKKIPNVKLTLVGDGEEKQKLINLANILGISKNVEITGWQKNIYPYLESANIFILSSIHEGFPTAILEAANCGLPIITTDVSGVREIIENETSGLIVPINNREKMVEAIFKLIEDESLREILGRKAREIVCSKFHVDNYLEKIESLYVNLTKQ
ncbi:MAG: glycosyltransferase [Candidatus Dadabacteria bacterium]|nr:glycosyltransferase [Candidatus Dadabacteria bacterium]